MRAIDCAHTSPACFVWQVGIHVRQNETGPLCSWDLRVSILGTGRSWNNDCILYLCLEIFSRQERALKRVCTK